MVLLGLKFDSDSLLFGAFRMKEFANVIMQNSEKPVAKLLFNVKAYCIESNVLVIHKEFIATQQMNMIFFFMLVGASIPWFVWGVTLPLFIVAGLMAFFNLLNTNLFNFLMFKLMIRRLGYTGHVRLL